MFKPIFVAVPCSHT